MRVSVSSLFRWRKKEAEMRAIERAVGRKEGDRESGREKGGGGKGHSHDA